MASIQRIVSPITKDISYRAQVRIKGHEPQGKTFPNRKEAGAWATSIESAIREARYFPNQKASRTPFAEIVARYRETAVGHLKESGASTRKQRLDWWLERFAGKTIAEITPDLVAQARDELDPVASLYGCLEGVAAHRPQSREGHCEEEGISRPREIFERRGTIEVDRGVREFPLEAPPGAGHARHQHGRSQKRVDSSEMG